MGAGPGSLHPPTGLSSQITQLHPSSFRFVRGLFFTRALSVYRSFPNVHFICLGLFQIIPPLIHRLFQITPALILSLPSPPKSVYTALQPIWMNHRKNLAHARRDRSFLFTASPPITPTSLALAPGPP